MLAKIKSGDLVKFPYTFADLQADNPYTNYGSNFNIASIFPDTEAAAEGFSLVEVNDAPAPTYDQRTQKIQQTDPKQIGEVWVREWVIIDRSADELAQSNVSQAQAIRDQRTQKLKDSDWTQVADAPVDKAAWATYRQALRDIPSQAGFPWDIQWPVEP